MEEPPEKIDEIVLPKPFLKKLGFGLIIGMLCVDSLALIFPDLKNLSPALERATIILHQLMK